MVVLREPTATNKYTGVRRCTVAYVDMLIVWSKGACTSKQSTMVSLCPVDSNSSRAALGLGLGSVLGLGLGLGLGLRLGLGQLCMGVAY